MQQVVKCHCFSSELHVGLQVEALGFKSESKYCQVAYTLMQEMSKVFLDEASRVRCSPVAGAIVVQSANWEFKNKFSGVTTCPVTKNHAYFMLLVSVVGCSKCLVLFGMVFVWIQCLCGSIGFPSFSAT